MICFLLIKNDKQETRYEGILPNLTRQMSKPVSDYVSPPKTYAQLLTGYSYLLATRVNKWLLANLAKRTDIILPGK